MFDYPWPVIRILTNLLCADYNKEFFSGKKRLYVQEVNSLGGSNRFLGILFICMAVLIVTIAFVFLALYITRIAYYPGGTAEFYNPDRL